MTRARPRYIDHDGFLMPLGFPVESFRSALEYEAQPGDIFVSTYPKCGTTWAQHIVYLIMHDGATLPPGHTMTEEFPHLEEMGRAFVEAMPPPRCIKIHLPYSMTPHHPEAKYVYVARNPFDCAVSFYHHTRGFVKHYDFADGTFDDYFECFLAGAVDFGDYFDNLISWYEHRDDESVLFLTYEAMKADATRAIVDIGRFLGEPWSRAVERPDTLAAIVHHSSFDSMRKDQGRWASRRPDDMPPFIRKGEVGDWRSHFSADQTRRLAAAFATRTESTDLGRFWPWIAEVDSAGAGSPPPDPSPGHA